MEVSTDGGTTWHKATGRSSWSYVWSVSNSGTVNIRSRAVDDSGNLETPSGGITITVPAPTFVTIWNSGAAPALADAGVDSPVELGVKFKADANGSIVGIRFYKSALNTGPHVANLWSSTGSLLATANFTAESSSGWQQVNFSTPVAITANTIYVASYHSTLGHYAADQDYFASSSFDNPPLHAVQNTGGVLNGVFGYGTSSVFPTSSFNASNYWVDVAFKPASTLSSISVTPANASIAAGSTQQFTATGTYSDGSTANITNQVVWSSSNTAVATMNSTGLATAVAGGNSTIKAVSGSFTGSTTLSVQVGALSITTASLPVSGSKRHLLRVAICSGWHRTLYLVSCQRQFSAYWTHSVILRTDLRCSYEHRIIHFHCPRERRRLAATNGDKTVEHCRWRTTLDLDHLARVRSSDHR